jgi:hypothetical protein
MTNVECPIKNAEWRTERGGKSKKGIDEMGNGKRGVDIVIELLTRRGAHLPAVPVTRCGRAKQVNKKSRFIGIPFSPVWCPQIIVLIAVWGIKFLPASCRQEGPNHKYLLFRRH